MSERRFSITVFNEIDESTTGHTTVEFTESELDNRLTAIYGLTADHTFFEKAIAILLHCPKCGKVLSCKCGEGEKGESNFGHFLKACDSQPSPTPTRREWEEAAWLIMKTLREAIEAGGPWESVADAILTMPCVQKE